MALIITYETESGLSVTGSYWRISSMRMDFPTEDVAPAISTILQGYVSAAARADGKPPMESIETFIPMADMLALAAQADSYTDLRAAAYAWVKANHPAFSGAVDV